MAFPWFKFATGLGSVLGGIGAVRSSRRQSYPEGLGSQPPTGNDGGAFSVGGITEDIFDGIGGTARVAQILGNAKQQFQGLGGTKAPSGAELGQRQREFLQTAYPGTNPWEQLGASGNPQQADHASIERQRLKTQEKIAKLQTDTQRANVAEQTQAQRDVANIGASAQLKARGIQPESLTSLQTAQAGKHTAETATERNRAILVELQGINEEAKLGLIDAQIDETKANEYYKLMEGEVKRLSAKRIAELLPYEVNELLATTNLKNKQAIAQDFITPYAAMNFISERTGIPRRDLLTSYLEGQTDKTHSSVWRDYGAIIGTGVGAVVGGAGVGIYRRAQVANEVANTEIRGYEANTRQRDQGLKIKQTSSQIQLNKMRMYHDILKSPNMDESFKKHVRTLIRGGVGVRPIDTAPYTQGEYDSFYRGRVQPRDIEPGAHSYGAR